MWLPKWTRKGGLWLPHQGLAMAGKFRFMPCSTCCGGIGCIECSDATPYQWLVTLNGYANSGCNDCLTFNDDFIVTLMGGPDPCDWDYQFSDPVCNVYGIRLWLIDMGGDVMTIVNLYGAGGYLDALDQFSHHSFSGTIPCASVSGLSLNHYPPTPDVDCDNVSATCIVTAL